MSHWSVRQTYQALSSLCSFDHPVLSPDLGLVLKTNRVHPLRLYSGFFIFLSCIPSDQIRFWLMLDPHSSLTPSVFISNYLSDIFTYPLPLQNCEARPGNQSTSVSLINMGCHFGVIEKPEVPSKAGRSFLRTHIAVSLGEIIFCFSKEAVRCVIYLERFLLKWSGFWKSVWERLEGKLQLPEDSSWVQNISLPSSTGSKDAGRRIKHVKAPSEPVQAVRSSAWQ